MLSAFALHALAPRGMGRAQAPVPPSALRAYLHDRAELLGREARVFVCADLVAPASDSAFLAKELGTAVGLIEECSSARGSGRPDVGRESLEIRRSLIAGDTLILVGAGFRGGGAASGPTEFTAWGERVALRRIGLGEGWFVVSITLTGAERGINRRPPRVPRGGDSTSATDASRGSGA